jgi:NADP-dependent 3-hydroxy acid dehydrogenase YdfG
VLVNDFSKEAADKVVKEINDQGVGEAIANYSDVTKGGEIIEQVMQKWGRVDVLINK